MPVILVVVDDPAARDPVVETLKRLFPWARVMAVCVETALPLAVSEGATVVVAGLSAAERLCREGGPPAAPVVALTREMRPDTLLRAEALGIAGALRAPPDAKQLATVLGPLVGAPPPQDHR